MANKSTSDLITTLSKLVNFRTVNSNFEQKNSCIDFIASEFANKKLYLRKHQSNGFPSLVVTTKNTKSPKLLLQAHLDVVPADETLFEVQTNNGKLIGRGVYDMKFAAACYIQLVRELQDSLSLYDFGIMFTTDEEVGGDNGVGYLLDQGYSGDVCLLPDGGDDWKLESECNGVWLVDIIAEGKTAHGSRPWEGVNAIDRIIDVLFEIKSIFPMNQDDKNTLTISKIHGGTAMNQVPSEARATLDLRFLNQESYSSKRVSIESIVQAAGLKIETKARLDSISLDTSQPHICEFLEIAEDIYGKKIEHGRSYGASDAHYFNSKGIPTILIRPNGGGAHSDEEWIEIEGLMKFYNVIKAYIVNTTKLS